jgi:hypothetical protein
MEGEIDDSCSMHGLLKCISISVGKLEERNHLENLEVDVTAILQWV